MRLKTDEYFKGHALFEPDPELEDNPGYYEYYDHFDNQANQYVPCTGDKCAFCRSNDNPSTRALTLWYFPDSDKKDQLKVFTMNFSTTQDMDDISEEEEGVLGKHFRIKRLTDRGEYRIRPTSEKKLTKKEIKEALKEAPDLEELVQKQAKVQMERLSALDALEDDEDDDVTDDEDEDDDEEETSAKGGTADDDEEDEDEDDEEDEDEDEEDDEDEDDDEDEEDEDENTEIADAEYKVLKFEEKDEVFTLEGDDGEVQMWLGDGVDAPDDVKKGSKITVSAIQDDEGDWVITDVEMKKSKRGRPKGSKTKSKK